jgi:CheY-like chemotaxis protein
LLSVADTGHGMDAATKQRIFEPFFTTKPKGFGTGLGLATVYGIVRKSNGHVSVYSELGMGAVFRIYLPCVAQARAESVELPPSQARFHGTETVLIVEDDDAVRSLAGSILRTHGYRVLDASDPAAALRICDDYAGKIDLVLTDLVMPRMNGTEFAQRVRGLRPGVRVLYTSGYSKEAVHRNGAAVTDETFVQKPYSTDTLMRKVRAALDMHHEG